jgi:hypothetical protein
VITGKEKPSEVVKELVRVLWNQPTSLIFGSSPYKAEAIRMLELVRLLEKSHE